MSKVIKPLLDENGCHVKRPIKVGEYYYSWIKNNYMQFAIEATILDYFIYYAEDWKPKEREKYYYYNFHFCEVISTYHTNNLFDKTNIATDNCFRTREEAEQADIQQILDDLKTYYKNKEGK